MKNLLNELNEFNEMLCSNVNADWSENDPTEEFSALSGILKKIIDKIPNEREVAAERLSHLICDDEDSYASYEEAIQLLEAQAEIDGSAMADHTVMMWEKVEFSFTVNELLSEIGIA
jgi:hypothetical protein